MLPHKHAAVSVVVGAGAWMLTGSAASGAAALIAGVFPDIDHIADYLYYRRRGEHRLILPLHGYEYVFLGGWLVSVTESPVIAAATISYLVHLLADQLENRTRWFGYSLLFRALYDFRIERISSVPDAAVQGRLDDLQRLQRWMPR